MENSEERFKHIKGWGIDADPENEPTYPMKHYTGDDHQRLNYERTEQQPVNDEILVSNERPRMTTVFGTTVPPSGLSGKIRRKAFKYSEGSYGHWLPLILADRIQVIEALIDDVKNGYFPNLFKERGLAAEWKYNRNGMIRNTIIRVGLIAAAAIIIAKRKTVQAQNSD